ncbi:MAG: AAA family ATPase, partial [Kineosporiaceae bacterium]
MDRWVEQAADRVVAAVAARQATWQACHVRAEAWRQVRGTAMPREHAEALVEQVVDAALTGRSVPVTPPVDDLPDPAPLRRRDGASMYTVHEATRYTSTAILAAEARIVAAGARTDGPTATDTDVDIALLEAAANGVDLNLGQAALVRAMATNPARLQLAIAPAGSGKTTAMRALARAWTESGGHVIGLAPSAAAAAALRDQLGAATDTLAKLTHAISAGALPDWAERVGPTTLVVLDEAAMADTLSLDAALTWILGRGGTVRLIGDDRQLSAIGAGGVLRDIEATHGALRLTELLRFTDPSEAAASLALREGDPEALGYYLDHHRVHVGDLATMTQDAFTAWQLDRDMGLDALMLAPTRALAAELNQRARAHRLAGTADTSPAAALAGGARVGVGDVVITRANDRRLRLSATDWVKNGDRWLVSAVHGDGSLSVHHTRHHLRVHLPADYVAASVDLGYATTIHTAQGVTADTMHGLLTGTESRQQLYTMLTRGRNANHLYLEVVGDGDPHTVIRPETIHPPTATDLLTAVLARDDSPTSASTQHRTATEASSRLGPATDRYSDALTVAAERLTGAAAINDLTHRIDAVLPGLDGEPAWPALRGHLLLLGLDGTDPLPRLTAAADRRDLDDAADRAAVLHWRLSTGTAPGPLPWLPAIPDALTTHPTWGPYLTARATLVAGLAAQVAEAAHTRGDQAWTRHLATHPSPELRRDIAVWRAATSIPDSDPRPLG